MHQPFSLSVQGDAKGSFHFEAAQFPGHATMGQVGV